MCTLQNAVETQPAGEARAANMHQNMQSHEAAREPVEIKGHIIARIQAEFIPCMNFPCRSPKLHVTIFYCTTEIICKVMKRVTGIIRSCHVVTLHYLAAVHKYLSPECTCMH